ncbi:MAG: GC-type dockerin domain-anchored protein, partial [Phycisphaerales bacterium JB059]
KTLGLGMNGGRISGGVSLENLGGGADVSEFAEGLALESNFNPGFGGGMYVRRGAVVRDCTFTDNFASDGGGAYVQAPTSGSRAEIAGCVFERNFAFGEGGGASGEATFNGCQFYANEATFGGGLFGDGLMVNCAVAGNGAYLDGGGAFFDGDVSNCTIVANRSGRSGGGLQANPSGVGIVGNCVLTMNQAGLSGDNLSGSYLQIAFSIVEGGLGDVDGVAGVDYIDDQNLDIDPGFVAPPDDGGDGFGDVVTTPDVDEGAHDFLGDLRLALGSPAIDAGNNFVLPLDDNDADGDGRTLEPIPFDLDGNDRIVDDPMTVDTGFVGDGEGVAGVDIGAYEFQPSPGGSPCPADLAAPMGVLNFDDVLAFLTAFGAMESAADLAVPFGEINFDDILAFLVAFGEGCP